MTITIISTTTPSTTTTLTQHPAQWTVSQDGRFLVGNMVLQKPIDGVMSGGVVVGKGALGYSLCSFEFLVVEVLYLIFTCF